MKAKMMIAGAAVVATGFGVHVQAYYRMHHHVGNSIAHHAAPAGKKVAQPVLLASR